MKSHAVILDGSLSANAGADRLLTSVVDQLDAMTWTSEVLPLRDLSMAPCTGCFGCWIVTPGECVIADQGRDVARQIVTSDLTVYLTPIQFGGYSYVLKRAIDRSIPIISPYFRRVGGEVHHTRRYRRYPSIVAFGFRSSEASEEDAIFETLVARNAINMHAPRNAVAVLDPGVEADIDRRVRETLEEVIGR